MRKKRTPLSKSGEHQVRTYVMASDHKRVVLFANRNEMRIIDAYSLIFRCFLDHDGRVKAEADKTSVSLSLKTFQLLEEKLLEYGTKADSLLYNLLCESRKILRTRTF